MAPSQLTNSASEAASSCSFIKSPIRRKAKLKAEFASPVVAGTRSEKRAFAAVSRVPEATAAIAAEHLLTADEETAVQKRATKSAAKTLVNDALAQAVAASLAAKQPLTAATHVHSVRKGIR